MDVISELMGVPEPDRVEVRRLADLVVHREEGVLDVPQAGMAAALTLVGYYADMLAQRRRQPTDDLTSALLAAEIEGDRLEDQEIIAFLFLMVVAGNETTTKLLGNALYHLTRHPDQLAAVFADEAGQALVEPWIEETLRFDTSSQMVARHLLDDVALHGRVAARAGPSCCSCSARPTATSESSPDPDEFDLHRDKTEVAQLLSFGGGRHFCLGANLARLEAQVALRELVRRARTVDVDHERAVRVHSTNVRGFAELPVSVEVR